MRTPQVIWERTYDSLISACTVTVTVLDIGTLEITIDSADGDTSWGERLDSIASREIAYQIQRAHSNGVIEGRA